MIIKLTLYEIKRKLANRNILLSNLFFLLINIIVYPFTLSVNQNDLIFLSSIMASILLGIVLITNNIFDEDARDGTLNQYVVFGIPMHIVFLSKVIASIIEFSLIISIVLPLVALIYSVSWIVICKIIFLILLSIPLITSISVFGAMLTLNSTKTGAMAILLTFPLLISSLIILSIAASKVMEGLDFLRALDYLKINIGMTLVLFPPITWLSKFIKG